MYVSKRRAVEPPGRQLRAHLYTHTRSKCVLIIKSFVDCDKILNFLFSSSCSCSENAWIKTSRGRTSCKKKITLNAPQGTCTYTNTRPKCILNFKCFVRCHKILNFMFSSSHTSSENIHASKRRVVHHLQEENHIKYPLGHIHIQKYIVKMCFKFQVFC